MTERALVFGKNSRMVGIRLHSSASAPVRVVLVNSGVVHRVGANRMTVLLARKLAIDGIDSLRFDMSGIGESAGRTDQLGWEASAPLEIQEAIDEIAESGTAVVLYGNCGGAAKSLWAAQLDRRVNGLLLTNPPAHPSEEEGIGEAGARRLAAEISSGVADLLGRGVRMLFLYAAGDSGLLYFEKRLQKSLAPHLEAGRLQVRIIEDSNHTFSPVWAREAVIELGREWLRKEFSARL